MHHVALQSNPAWIDFLRTNSIQVQAISCIQIEEWADAFCSSFNSQEKIETIELNESEGVKSKAHEMLWNRGYYCMKP